MSVHAGESANGGLGQVLNTIQMIEDHAGMSITQYVRRSMINSRVFIENSLSGEEILNPLLLNVMNLYVGFVTTAMGMNQYISNTQRVRDVMNVVSTESFDARPIDVGAEMAAYFAAEDPLVAPVDGMTSTDTNIVQPDYRDATLPSGRIIKVDFNVCGQRFAINMFLQLQPTFIPSDVAKQFIGLNFTPSLKQRWMQVSAGEISMINDLILGNDLRKNRMKALKNDKDGVLQQMLDRQSNSLFNAWMKLGQITPERQNIANTILIFEKNSFDRACNSAGLKFSVYGNRQKFFNKTFSLMVITVDPMYNKVTIYYHGLQEASTFTFDQLKKNAKTEATDILAMMKNYAQGMAPKF